MNTESERSESNDDRRVEGKPAGDHSGTGKGRRVGRDLTDSREQIRGEEDTDGVVQDR